MGKKKFKYNINHQISLLPRARDMHQICADLEKRGIPMRTFYNDRSILSGDPRDIPSERLLIYAQYFEVTMEAMFNKPTHTKIKTQLQ